MSEKKKKITKKVYWNHVPLKAHFYWNGKSYRKLSDALAKRSDGRVCKPMEGAMFEVPIQYFEKEL